MDLKAIIFDVDGTLVETERQGHRVAFNRAFERTKLPDRWDEDLYGELLSVAGGRERLLHYFGERCQNPPGDPEALAAELHGLKVEEFAALARDGLDARSGILRLLNELRRERITTAVATTGTRGPVLDLLRGLGSGHAARFAAVLTAQEAPKKKPDPQVYDMALARLGLSPCEALTVEDSRNGLLAAKSAGLSCLVTVSDYSADESFSEADLVVRSLGEPDTPAEVLSDPHGLTTRDNVVVDLRLLRSLHQSCVRAGDGMENR